MRIFWDKNVKITSGSGALPPNPPLPLAAGTPAADPHVITPAYYCKFAEFISCANCILLPSKDYKVTTVNVLILLLLQLSHLFFISNYSFC